ncbi:two-component system regulatory protein YycI [Pullulanibacillus sp. KACC 23026]|uniref:two-component system regulatory protein YycI n=1 Tax=Pullulanibacillus sp. KACC 23026 TaxID=3028315 RepID=UPI0023B02825|nr:two-component system regulatory protein YycI [Pullulanibacillus sp. KACC 23026]WEG12813.1 two-component system regulatory protein YycI [Pullulanibacillus sp. KACC 23026]
MNWSKTKTIFIICFLLLDIFLTYQLISRQKGAQNQENSTQSSFSQYIKNKDIQINTTLPDTVGTLTFLSGSYQDFGNSSNKALSKALKALAGPAKKPVQMFTTDTQSTVLKSTFVNKVSVPETQTDQQTFLNEYVYMGDQYRFWSYDKDEKIYKFIQTYNGHPVFSITNGHLNTLDMTLDKSGKYITGYTQSFVNIKKEKSTKLGVQPMEAIQQLWEKNMLSPINKPVIQAVELGYINMSENSDQSQPQPFAYLPAWYIEVKTTATQDVKRYFVTAITGRIQTIDGGE